MWSVCYMLSVLPESMVLYCVVKVDLYSAVVTKVFSVQKDFLLFYLLFMFIIATSNILLQV